MNTAEETQPTHVMCMYRRELIPVSEAIKFSGFTDMGIHFLYFHKDEVPRHKESRKAFDHSERNCNTCIHLNRVKHPKSEYGFLQAQCKQTPIDHPYASRFKEYDGNMLYHPNDPMHMQCYEPRNP